MNKKKRILILVMSCNDQFFINQVNKIKNTWGKDIIEGKYENIDFLSYRGGNLNIYNKNEHDLILHVEDNLENTFKKTIYALMYITKHIGEYDYIFRTNTSTYINVPLLDAFVQSLETDDVVYTSELYSLIEANCPKPLDLYGRGNGLLFPKKMIDILISESTNLIYMGICDDIAIGNVLNSYWIKNNINYIEHIKSFCHGWYKAVDDVMYVDSEVPDYLLCTFDNKNGDFNFLKKFVTIQTKMYYSRELEDTNYDEVHEIFSNNTDNNINESIQFNKKYSENPNIFIGSILGYIQYDFWANTDKRVLYVIQANNKADNDIYCGKFVGTELL